jgi:OmpA-OmpF porin, OOP family
MSISSLRFLLRGAALAAALGALGGCATRSETVILLPAADGSRTSVVVKGAEPDVVLDTPYAAFSRTAYRQRTYTSSAEEVRSMFGGALDARPSPPATFTLHFVEGRNELTEESKREVDGVLAEIARRPVPDVVVVGHTDTVGSDQVNDTLALQRAEVIRRDLLQRGLAPENVQAIGRGKRELAVPTADNVPEPRNRRVVILVR